MDHASRIGRVKSRLKREETCSGVMSSMLQESRVNGFVFQSLDVAGSGRVWIIGTEGKAGGAN